MRVSYINFFSKRNWGRGREHGTEGGACCLAHNIRMDTQTRRHTHALEDSHETLFHRLQSLGLNRNGLVWIKADELGLQSPESSASSRLGNQSGRDPPG